MARPSPAAAASSISPTAISGEGIETCVQPSGPAAKQARSASCRATLRASASRRISRPVPAAVSGGSCQAVYQQGAAAGEDSSARWKAVTGSGAAVVSSREATAASFASLAMV